MFRRIGQTRIIQPGRLGRALKGAPPFKPGDSIRGTVVQKLPGEEVLLTAGRRRFQARVTAPLREGGRYLFKVLASSPRLDLKVLNQEKTVQPSPLFLWLSTRKSRGLLGTLLEEFGTLKVQGRQGPALEKALDQLRRILPALVFRGSEKALSRWLSQAFFSSGLFWESKVARFLARGSGQALPEWLAKDLKGSLLTLEKAIMEGDSLENRLLMLSQAREAIQFVEHDQLFNLASRRDGIGWYWFIPGQKDGGFHGGEVFVEGKKEGGGIAVTLLLQTSHLGLLKVALSLFEKVVHVRISVKKEETVDFIDQHLQELKKGFEEKGMSLGFMKCEVEEDLDFEDIPAPWADGISFSLDLRI